MQSAGFFNFTVTESDFVPNRDIVIVLKGREDYRYAPELFISDKNPHPNGETSTDLVCGLDDVDVCAIDAEDI